MRKKVAELERAPGRKTYELDVAGKLLRDWENFGGSLGLAVLGAILINQNVSRVGDTLGKMGVLATESDRIAGAISGGGAANASSGGSRPRKVFEAVQLDFAHSTNTVVYAMAAVMALAFLVALTSPPAGLAGRLAEEPDTLFAPATG